MFLFYPQQALPSSHVAMTAILTVVTIATLTFISVPAAILLSLAIVFITFGCPAWLISLQTYKKYAFFCMIL